MTTTTTLTEQEIQSFLLRMHEQKNICDAASIKRPEKDFRIIFSEKILTNKTEWSDGERVCYAVSTTDCEPYSDLTRDDLPRLIEAVQAEFPYSQTCVYIFNIEAPAGIFEATIYAKTKEKLEKITKFLTKYPDREDGEFRLSKASVTETTYEELEKWLVE